MEFNEEIYEYIEGHIDAEPAELHRLERRSNLEMLYGRMCSGHWQGRLLKMLTRMIRPRRVLELGTFTGYATLCLAEGMAEWMREEGKTEWMREDGSADVKGEDGSLDVKGEDGSLDVKGEDRSVDVKGEMDGCVRDFRVVTIEIFDENEDFLRRTFAGSPYGSLVDLIIGDVMDEMPRMEAESFDLIFIDADKRLYPEYYAEAKRLVRRGGYIIADNTLWDGHVVDATRRDSQTMGVKAFNDIVATDPDVEKVILPLRDGLTIIRRRV